METSDYDPGPWKGHDFKSARAAYDKHAGRAYTEALATGKSVNDLVPDRLTTQSESPLIIACDVTGSMGDWPKTIFSKLPYLELEGKEYLGDTMEISFSAIGDVFSDKFPIQVRNFVKGTDLEKELKSLIIEGNGGGTAQESYDIMARYYADNVDMPNAIRKPIFIFIGDEGLYTFLDREHAEHWAKTKVSDRQSVERVIQDLQGRYNVYIVRRPYNCNMNSPSDAEKRIQKQWEALLGDDHVVSLPDASRVVDVIFGILAKETGRIDYFKKEITDRQKPEQIDVVMKSLKTIHAKALPAPSVKKIAVGKSITRKKDDDDGKPAKSLI
jgi:hypothetical protein